MMDGAAPTPTTADVTEATLDAKLNELREAWTKIEERKADKKLEMKSFSERIKAAEDQRDALLREPHESGQPAIVLDQARTLQLKIDGLEIDAEHAAERHKRLIDEATSQFRSKLFGEQLPLLLPEGATRNAEVNPDGGQVVAVSMPDGTMLRVGQVVTIHGIGAPRPGVILELDPAEDPAKHGAVVRYDGTDPTPAHVMAHQCRGVVPEQAADVVQDKPARGRRRKKDAPADSEADAVAGTIEAPRFEIGAHVLLEGKGDYVVQGFEAGGEFVQLKAAKKPRGKKHEAFTVHAHRVAPMLTHGPAPMKLRIGDRVRLLDHPEVGGAPTDIEGRIEAILRQPTADQVGRVAVRWNGKPDDLSEHDMDDLAKPGRRSKALDARAEPDLPDDGRYDTPTGEPESIGVDGLPLCVVCGDEVSPHHVGAIDGDRVTCRTCTGDDAA